MAMENSDTISGHIVNKAKPFRYVLCFRTICFPIGRKYISVKGENVFVISKRGGGGGGGGRKYIYLSREKMSLGFPKGERGGGGQKIYICQGRKCLWDFQGGGGGGGRKYISVKGENVFGISEKGSVKLEIARGLKF